MSNNRPNKDQKMSTKTGLEEHKAYGISKNINLRLFILSVWMLFLELFLIRWISTEIRIFAYVTNLIMLGCFLGIGIGCYFSDKKINVLFSFAMLAITVLAVQSSPFRGITNMLGTFQDSVIWSQKVIPNNLFSALKGIILTLLMFSMVMAIFFPLGQLLGRMIGAHNKIVIAYSINILGSIAGVWLFSFLSFIYTNPVLWLNLSMILGLTFVEKRRFLNGAIFLLLVILSTILMTKNLNNALLTLWTPYQRLDIYKINLNEHSPGYVVNVNNTNYMELLDISQKFVGDHSDILGVGALEKVEFGEYDIPYQFKSKIENVLIVGAGGGNDVAGALRRNIKNIDAVEIDKGVYRLGLSFHPEKPYENESVHVYIDDARSFFKKTNKKYDIISFGLLDSHTASSSYNNMRLDHYIYTLESFSEAKNLLKDDGVMTVAFAVTRVWIAQRLYGIIKTIFKAEPYIFHVSPYGGEVLNRKWVMFVISNNMSALKETINSHPRLRDYMETNRIKLVKKDAKLTTDDWPYLYLANARIPYAHICIILSLLVLFLFSGRMIFWRRKKLELHFFFLGAAFMLLEFQNITKASLLFGSTWIVNAYIVSAILLLILFANMVSHYFSIKNINFIYLLLCLSLLTLYFIPLNSLNMQNNYVKATLFMMLLNLPVFFAGIIFINSLKNYSIKNLALGSNLLGAAFGGLCESLSFVWGIKALVLLVLVFYGFSYLAGRKIIFQ